MRCGAGLCECEDLVLRDQRAVEGGASAAVCRAGRHGLVAAAVCGVPHAAKAGAAVGARKAVGVCADALSGARAVDGRATQRMFLRALKACTS